LIKQLLGEGYQIRIWDPFVSVGKLVGSNREFIEVVIPHIGSLLCQDLREVVESAEVVLIGTKVADREQLYACLRTDQIIIDLVDLK